MQHLEELNTLIDQASRAAGSDYQLAKALGVDRQAVSNWRHGRRTATPEDQVLLAGVAGLDPAPILARAIVEKHEGTPKGDRLMRVLGKASRLTGAVAGIVGAVALVISGLMAPNRAEAGLKPIGDNVYYVKSTIKPRRSPSFPAQNSNARRLTLSCRSLRRTLDGDEPPQSIWMATAPPDVTISSL